ncbi:MAG: diaminopimelate decarboxylase [Chloroflexi bacterium]|nr:diaminopimelate decarboxylase [Chloroflexota bacterium]
MPHLTDNDREIFPVTAGMDDTGDITVGGCSIKDLATEFGTPLYIFDEATVRHMCRQFTKGFKNAYERSHVEYSSKAFANPALAKIIAEEGLHMDVVTGGELAFAKVAGFPAERLNFHGNNKGRQELGEAIDYGIGRITIDSFYEIGLLNEVAGERGVRQKVMLRVSPSVDPHTHMLTTTGVLDSKFGFSIETGAAAEAVKQAMAAPNLEVRGLHFHLGSPIFELEPYSQAVDYVLKFAAEMRDKYGLNLKEFNPGGGFAVGYIGERLPLPISAYANEISSALRSGCDRYGLNEPELTVEPGRAIVARAGVAAYTVGGIKRIPNVRVYVSVDGGMGDNIRPALYSSKYTVRRVTDPYATPKEKVTVVGKYCESGDYIARDVELPNLNSGDVLCTPTSGAYAIPMSSNYNMTTRPAIVMVKDGNARLIRRRETYEDLLATSLV